MHTARSTVVICRPHLASRLGSQLAAMLCIRRCRLATVFRNTFLLSLLVLSFYEFFRHFESLTDDRTEEFLPWKNLTRILTTNTSANGSSLSSQKENDILEERELLILGADDIYEIQSGKIAADDIRLMEYIRRLTIGPSESGLNLTDPTLDDHSQVEQAAFVDYALGYREQGFFVECGAGDGETYSNTLFFEQQRRWSGLLIEPHPGDYQRLLGKRRKSYSLNACISPGNHSSLQKFRAASGFISGLYGYVDHLHSGTDFKSNWWFQRDMVIQCFPLTSILMALNIHHVDFLSIDIEGPEVEVLQSIPFNNIRIDVITVEYRAKGDNSDLISRSMGKLALIRKVILATKLYDEIGILPPLKIFNRNQAMQSQAALEKTGLDVVFRRRDIRESQDYHA